MEWTRTLVDHGWPDWVDGDRPIEIMDESGNVVSGVLIVDDFFPLDDGDEVPVFAVQDGLGNKHSFADSEKWRFAD